MKGLEEGGREKGSGGGGEKGGLRVCDKELQVLLDGGYHYYYFFLFFFTETTSFLNKEFAAQSRTSSVSKLHAFISHIFYSILYCNSFVAYKSYYIAIDLKAQINRSYLKGFSFVSIYLSVCLFPFSFFHSSLFFFH